MSPRSPHRHVSSGAALDAHAELVSRSGSTGARSVRARIAIAALLAVSLVAVVVGSALIVRASHRYHEEARQQAAALLGSLAVPSAMAVAVDSLDRLDGYLEEVVAAGEVTVGLRTIAMLDHRGLLLAHSGSGGLATALGDAGPQAASDDERAFVRRAIDDHAVLWRRYRADDGTPMLQVSMPAVSGLRWGTLVASFDVSRAVEQVRETATLVALGAAGMATLVLALVYLGLARIVLAPIGQLAETARALGEGDLNARAVVETHDELGELAMSFNAMARELQSYTEGLERKVEERTEEVRRQRDELEAVNGQLQDAVKALERMAKIDALTELCNRRHFSESLAEAMDVARAEQTPLSVAILDADHFKQVNDTWGHGVGDQVLQGVARALTAAVRDGDVVARYGGEEFVVLLPGVGGAAAAERGESIREAVEADALRLGGAAGPTRVTVSVGVASFPADAAGLDALLQAADHALYEAKRGGRNRVERYRRA